MTKLKRRIITLSLIASIIFNYCLSLSSVFPVLFNDQSISNAEVEFTNLDYNTAKKMVAAAGYSFITDVFDEIYPPIITRNKLELLVSVFDESQDMILLW